MKLNSFEKFSWFVLVFNLAVILWGAFVRASKSGAGCGSHWPLCNGAIVPTASQTQTLVEFAHRLTSGAAFLLVIAMAVWAWRAFPAGHRVRAGAGASIGGMIAETLAGAGLVLFNWVADDISFGRVIIMPTHLVITFYLLAALTLTAWWASFDYRSGFADRSGDGAAIQTRDSSTDAQGARAWMLGIGLIATLVMGMAGAVTALGDTVLPVASLTPGSYEKLSPAGRALVEMRVWHPLIAVGVAIYLWFVVNFIRAARRDYFVTRFSTALIVLFLIELGAGVVNVYLHAPIWMQLLHLLLANLTWILLILLSAATLARDESTK
ncbi:MAG: COX15/CtaA family protein [Chloroflexi bacterium]|nr:COX15/CtaA family protein [Chloroflexota bacterium]